MIGISNLDSSFFTVESDDVTLKDQDFSHNLISLSVTEKMVGVPQGTLSFYDPENIYSRILRSYARLKISWGFKRMFETPDSLLAKKINLDEISGDIVRRGLEVMISNPSGGGDQNGVTTYNCDFTALGMRGSVFSRKFDTGTKQSVVSKVFDEIKIDPSKRYIDFSRGSENVDSDRAIFQDESSYAFLTRLAREWQCLFKVGWSDKGETTGIFMDTGKVGVPGRSYPSWVGNASGQSHVIGYKGVISNVKSYTWENNEGESGIGDNVHMAIVGGQITFKRFLAEEEKVVAYRLDVDKIEKAFGDRVGEGLDSQIKLAKELLSAKDFKSVQKYFTAIDETTAPQGYGYRIKAEMIGNPLFCPPNLITINNGFPDRIGGKNTKFYLNEVTHKIDMSGYHMSIEVVDAFVLSPTGVPIL